MCWCWGAFQAFYGIEASFISRSWRQHLACLLSGLTLIALVLPHWNCTLYIYNFFFCSIASTYRSSGKSSLTRSMLGSGILAHTMPVLSIWEDRTNPTLRFSREMMFLELSAAWVVSTAAQVVLDEVLGVMCLFFFYEISQPWCVSHWIVWMLCKES